MVREVAEGERVRCTRYDKELGVRSGDLGTAIRIGQDSSMIVKPDSGNLAEASSEEGRYIEYGYAVDGFKRARADRVIATGDSLTHQVFLGASSKADLTLYTGSAAAAQEFSVPKEVATHEIAQPVKQHDFGIRF